MNNHMSAKGGPASGGKYYFVLGNNATLSIAELSAIFDEAKNGELFDNRVFVIDLAEEIDAPEIMKKLGGTIKIGLISAKVDKRDFKRTLKKIKDITDNAPTTGKFNFGFSFYGKGKLNIKSLAMELKKYLKEERDMSSRWVISKEPVLSSVVVETNKLAGTGMEIVLIEDGKNILIGKTLTVQPFKELSFRDYGRPSRDDLSGMLPPKLAQIMINLSQTNKKAALLDPFCGSGTILSEAMLMGYQNLIGSDISQKAIDDTKKNLDWIKDNFQFSIDNYQLIKADATQISKHIETNSIDAIITEPFLGPQRGKLDIAVVTKELNQLYSSALAEFKKILKPNGVVVMAWPVFFEKHFLSPDLHGLNVINPFPEKLRGKKSIKLTERNTIIYGRPGQKVWREIIILK